MKLAVPLLTLVMAQSPHAVARPEPENTIRIVWFGRTGGVSGHYGRNRAHLALFDAVGRGLSGFTPVADGPRAFARAGRLLFAEGGLRIADFHAFLAAGPFERVVVAEEWALRAGPLEVVFEYPPAAATPVLDLLQAPGDPPPAQGRLVRFTNAQGASVLALELPDADPAEPLAADASLWEVRFVFEAVATPAGGAPRQLVSVGRPLHDGVRRVPAIEALVAEAPERTLVLAAGEDVEDFSFVETGRPDRQRPHTWASFRQLGLAGLAPGAAEAAFGLEHLAGEAAEAGVSVLAANVGGEHSLAPARLVEVGERAVLLVGVVDPGMDPLARQRGFDEHPLLPPAQAVCDAVAEARQSLGRRPDLVVAFGVLPAAERARLTAECGEVDLLLADFEDRGLAEVPVQTAVVAPALRARDRHPLVVAPAGATRLGVVDVAFGADGRLAAHSRAVPVYATAAPDEGLLRRVQATRQAAYAPAQVPLLPDLGAGIAADPALRARFEEDPMVRRAARAGASLPPRITAGLWRQLVTNTLMSVYDAELVLMPALPVPWPLEGSISRLEALADLNVPDEVVVVYLSAAQVAGLAASPALGELVTAGFDPSVPAVRGRALDARERYRVVTTDALREDPRFAELLAGAAEDEGPPAKVREVVIDALAARSGEPERLLALLRPAGTDLASRWVVDAREVAVEASLYSVLGEQAAYGQVRETRVTTAAHRLVGSRGAFSVSREAASLDWVNSLRWAFAKAYYLEGDDQETADDLVISSELRLQALSIGGRDSGVPFVGGAWLTEFTPTENPETGEENPRKKRVEGALGLLWKGEVLAAARIAAVVAHDFAEEEPDPQVGFLGVLQIRQPLGPVLLGLDLEARYYLPGVGLDSPSALGTILAARAGLDVPVLAGVAVGIFADLFGYRGQHETTGDPGASLVSGFALKFDRRFKPGF